MGLLRAAATVGSLTMVSRVLGFVRDVLTAQYLGAGLVADAFVIAFKLPNFFRRLFAEGAFNNAFVPLYTDTRTQAAGEARIFAAQAQSVLALTLLVLTAAALFYMDYVVLVFAPGFAEDPEKLALTIELSTITFPYLLTISLVALYGAVLNAHGKFAAVAATPILLNLCLIVAIMIGGEGFSVPQSALATAQALAWGIAAAGLAQLVWVMVFSMRAGTFLWPTLPRLSPRVKRLLILMGPAVLAVSVAQINTLVDMILASTLGEGAVSWLYYADRLYQLPLGVIGVAMGTALLPMLSRQVANQNTVAATHTQNRALEAVWFLTIPAAVGLAMAAEPIMIVLFERGAFDAHASAMAGAALMAYAAGLPAFVAVKVLGPGFFARQDTTTPTKIAMVSMGANIGLNFLLMGPFGHVGLALATALASWINTSLLAYVLYRRGYFQPDVAFVRRIIMQVISAAVMAVVVWFLVDHFADWWRAGTLDRVLALGAVIGAGGVCFMVLALATRAVQVSDLKSLAQRK